MNKCCNRTLSFHIDRQEARELKEWGKKFETKPCLGKILFIMKESKKI